MWSANTFNYVESKFFSYAKIFNETKLKANADNKLNANQIMSSVFDRGENIVGKGENALYQHFLRFP